jgi:hypothetical protein
MARYILIDNYSGFIWGDSADLEGQVFTGTPLEFAAALDKSVDPSAAAARSYEEVGRTALFANESGYLVYRADPGASVPVVQDGQDQDMIELVERDCQYVTTIRITDAAEG